MTAGPELALPETASARLARLRKRFEDRFQAEATTAVRAPGRVELMGSHTDYNDGWVLTLSVDRDCWILARPRSDDQCRLLSDNTSGACTFSAIHPRESKLPGWACYAQGVAVAMADAGHPLTACDALIHGTIPLGGGLSSSAALEVAVACLFQRLGGFELAPLDTARLAQRAENDWVGMPCGMLDQYSVVFGQAGQALKLDCRALRHESLDLPGDLSLVVCDTGVPRALTDSAYRARRSSCERVVAQLKARDPSVKALRDVSPAAWDELASLLDPVDARRARFIMEENDRVHALATALEANDRPAMGTLMDESFAGARDCYEITVPAMLAMHEAAHGAPGCMAVRQTGAGFGGCLVALVESGRVSAFIDHAAGRYRSQTGVTPRLFPMEAAAGAGDLNLT